MYWTFLITHWSLFAVYCWVTAYLATAEVVPAEVTWDQMAFVDAAALLGACLVSCPGIKIKAGRRLIFTGIQGYFYSDWLEHGVRDNVTGFLNCSLINARCMLIRMGFSYPWVKKHNSADNCILHTVHKWLGWFSDAPATRKLRLTEKLTLSTVFSWTIW